MARRTRTRDSQDTGSAADEGAIIGVAVDSKVGAVRYYERFGFNRFERSGTRSDTIPMFLGLRTVEKAMSDRP